LRLVDIYCYAQVVVQHVGVSHTLDLQPGHILPRGQIIHHFLDSNFTQIIVKTGETLPTRVKVVVTRVSCIVNCQVAHQTRKKCLMFLGYKIATADVPQVF
jgi:hypothetical protein